MTFPKAVLFGPEGLKLVTVGGMVSPNGNMALTLRTGCWSNFLENRGSKFLSLGHLTQRGQNPHVKIWKKIILFSIFFFIAALLFWRWVDSWFFTAFHRSCLSVPRRTQTSWTPDSPSCSRTTRLSSSTVMDWLRKTNTGSMNSRYD